MPGQPGPSTTGMMPAGAGRAGEIDQRLVDCLVRVFGQSLLGEVSKVVSSAATGESLFAVPVFLDDHRDRQLHQRPDVSGEQAVAARHQHDVVFGADVGHHLFDARVARAGSCLDSSSMRIFSAAPSEATGSSVP